MPNCKLLCAWALPALLAVVARPASAQVFEDVGVRAHGLGGAFVALADDATATWWNPAGLATGAYLSAVIERGRTTEPVSPLSGGPARRATASDVAVGFPALGLSYYRLRISEIAAQGSTAGDSANRQDQTAGDRVRTAAISQFGATVGQGFGDHFVIGSTLKLLRGGTARSGASDGDLLDAGDRLAVDRQTKADLDLGAMVTAGRLRLGLAVRNLTTPTFGEGADRLQLKRQARVGMAVLSTPHALFTGVKVAADADLTTTTTATGEVRHVAGGAEAWLRGGRLGLRAGVSANTTGERRPAGSVGASVALTRAFHVNASKTTGRDDSVAGWSTSVSATF